MLGKDKKTTWFNAEGNFETKIPMTSTELSNLLDEINDKYDVFFGGSIKPVFDIGE